MRGDDVRHSNDRTLEFRPAKTTDYRVSVAFVSLAAFCWGISGGIGGILTANDWAPSMIALYRGAAGLIIMVAWLAIGRRYSGLADHRLWFWSTVAGLGVAGNFLFYFISIRHGNVATASTLMYCAPIYVFLGSYLMGLERVTMHRALQLACILLGIVLLTQLHSRGAGSISPWAALAGLLSGLSYAVFIFGFKSASLYGTPQAVLTVAFAVIVLTVTPLSSPTQILAPLSSSDRFLFLALGVLGAGLSFVLYVTGVRRTPPTVAALVASIEPVTAALFGIFLLDEQLKPLQVFGMTLILFTVTLGSVINVTPLRTRG